MTGILAEETTRIFNLDSQLLFDALFLAVNIFLLFLVASFFLFNPVRNLLKKRQDMIEADIEAAKKDKEDAAVLKSEYDEKIKAADKDADMILAEARKKGLAKEEQIIEEAKAEAGRIIDRANNEIELEKKRAADDMKKEIIAVATAMASKVVSGKIDADIQESLVDDTLNEMGDNTWQS
ncbi:MAG: F0F1 ATP synthase subunit B [Butyrivibrio sp.]|nr:F0F1 ATP synthase subunit B [Butyrivibrio sp.]